MTNVPYGMHHTIPNALRQGDRTVAGAMCSPVADEVHRSIRPASAMASAA
jgi:hypothetical protein